MKIPCVVRLSDDSRSWIEADIVAFVPRLDVRKHEPCVGGGLFTQATNDAMVVLRTFDKDGFYQIPIDRVRHMESVCPKCKRSVQHNCRCE